MLTGQFEQPTRLARISSADASMNLRRSHAAFGGVYSSSDVDSVDGYEVLAMGLLGLDFDVVIKEL
jgi:hypothetical protein